MSRIESIDLCLLVLVVVYVGMYIFSWGHAETLLKQGRAADKSCMDSTYHYEYPPIKSRYTYRAIPKSALTSLVM